MKKSAKQTRERLDPESARRIRLVLKKTGMTQAQLVRRLGKKFGKASVSLWLKGRIPSGDAYRAIGRLAPHPDNLWFYMRSGDTRKDLLRLSRQLLRNEAEQLLSTPSEIIRVPAVERTNGERETGIRVALPGEFAPADPSKAEAVVVTDATASADFAPGDVLVIDATDADSQVLTPFWDKVVLVEFFKPEPNVIGQTYSSQFPERGLYLGRLRYKRVKHERELEKPGTVSSLSWAVTLGPCNDSQSLVVLRMTEFPVRTVTLKQAGVMKEVPTWGVESNLVGMTIGGWQENLRRDFPEFQNTDEGWARAEQEAQRRVPLEAELYAGVRILGLVLSRYWPPSEKG